MGRRLIVREEIWDIGGGFSMSRSRKWAAEVLMVEIHEGGLRGRGEGVPNRRQGEKLEDVAAQIAKVRDLVESGSLNRAGLQTLLPPGAARNALDCAYWDLESKLKDVPVWKLASLPEPKPLITAFTITLDKPAAMAAVAREHRHRPLLKLKLGGPDDLERVREVRAAAPEAKLIVDVNEAWTPVTYSEHATELARMGVKLLEQPLPAGQDAALASLGRSVPLCADESLHDSSDLAAVAKLYDFVNIKLDKAGGLTEAAKIADAARDRGISIMIGCMVGTSLGMAPAFLLGAYAQIVDLDGPLLLAEDRPGGIQYDGGIMQPPTSEFWG
ncbi:MAG: dipeptide epimerase [Alphaproteobacteria bacterium]|jgi:L-Ala-D/L-Glu epimerase|nr:dipeptide epimerase [Alphaproteobacteria bacterium]MBT4710095.1 dipeptide epimerase [Alphaproteobacteria bacterium]MBT5860789.1 dipeptide epimerase [Alphaproteobacteria bacterium]